MTLRDRRDVPTSTSSAAALAHYERAAQLLHSYRGDPLAAIDAALAEDPRFVLGHCFKAFLLLSMTERRLEEAAREALARGEQCASAANARERGHLAALRAWSEGDLDRAALRYGEVLVEHPRDLLALQAGHLLDFYLGQQPLLRDRVAQVLHAWDDEVPGYGYVLGMYAFGLEETGDYARAELLGRRAVALDPQDAWAHHAVAHVMEMQARLGEGVSWLEQGSRHWGEDCSFAYHNWWHLALYWLDLGEPARVLELYDTRVRPGQGDVNLELVDASALLWRLGLRGVDVGRRWAELAQAWAPFTRDRYYAFNDAHAMMALVGAGRFAEARALLSEVEASAQASGTHGRMTREVGLPLCRALLAFGQGQYGACVDALLPVRHSAFRFGGSNAQRDLLALTLAEAALRSRRHGLARALASERTRLKPESPFNWLLTARALSALGDAPHAVRARLQAERLRALGLGAVTATTVARDAALPLLG